MRQVIRYERKYALTYAEYKKLSHYVGLFLPKDSHTGLQGYRIRSLYFDTPNDNDFFEKLEGISCRKKIRLRLYDPAVPYAYLEMKQKEDDRQKKRSLKITRQDAQALIQGDYSPLLGYQNPFADECFACLYMQSYRPKAVVEYIRMAYEKPENKTRITFDREIRSNQSNFDIFSQHMVFYPVVDGDQVIMEVKFNHFLLEYIKNLINHCDRSQTAASKYCMGRYPVLR